MAPRPTCSRRWSEQRRQDEPARRRSTGAESLPGRYRDRLGVWDYPDCDTSKPVEVTVILDDLSDEDRDHFEPYLEGRRDDGSFGGWDSPEEEFDQAKLVLRLQFRGDYGEPSRAFFARPEAGEASVRQADKIRIGWQYVPAGLDPDTSSRSTRTRCSHDCSSAQTSPAARSDPRRRSTARRDRSCHIQRVADARKQLQQSAQRSGTRAARRPARPSGCRAQRSSRAPEPSAGDAQAGARRRTCRSPSHGRGVLRVLLLAALLQGARADGGNLILAVEEPEQNLEPINQRLVTRSLLLAEDAGAQQVLLTYALCGGRWRGAARAASSRTGVETPEPAPSAP